jgi:dolichyl-phosphate-mannose-protein mannosyltransferase
MRVQTGGDAGDHRAEILVIGCLTLVGGLIRFWSLPRLGLNHFDEGIYALAGLWIFSPHGLLGIDPTTIAYAPPGFAALVGLSYQFFGVGDIAAILVSLLAGTATIPAVGWVAWRTFGRGAGAAAAGLVALAGPHIVFSRMALTDSLFLLCWTIALGVGQRFVERPGASRGILLGICVGVAQLVKYNGYLMGLIVAASAGVWLVMGKRQGDETRAVATWLWGGVGAVVAAIIYLPWFVFVERHGGYAALLAHHRGYLGGLASWPGHLSDQLDEGRVLSGGLAWSLSGAVVAALANLISLRVRWRWSDLGGRALGIGWALTICVWWPFIWTVAWAVTWPASLANASKRTATPAKMVLAGATMCLMILTPFYHPYARLWLPMDGLGWVIIGSVIGPFERRETDRQPQEWSIRLAFQMIVALCLLGSPLFLGVLIRWQEASHFAVLGPTDSLKIACANIRSEIPKTISRVRLYARPPVTFYLAGEIATEPQPSLDALKIGSNGKTWAIVDSAMLRQDGKSGPWSEALGSEWVLVKEERAVLSVATLLDIDPSSAVRGSWDAEAPILLFRPKGPEDLR